MGTYLLASIGTATSMDSMKELNEEGEEEECTGPKPTYEAQQSKYFLTNENRFERVRDEQIERRYQEAK